MSTAIFGVAISIPDRINELNRLNELAKVSESTDEQTYNTLCRACCVLLAAHLEGFLKDLSNSLATDLNFYVKSFSKMPDALKRSFCEKIAYYEGIPAAEINNRSKQLMTFFTTNSVSIDLNAFPYKENKNRNAGPDVLEQALTKLGVPSVLTSMAGGRLENIFKNDLAISYAIRRDMKKYRSCLYQFPYRTLPNKYKFEFKGAKTAEKISTMWHDFIEDIMQRRHSIMHGDTMKNETSANELSVNIEKMDVLMHGVLFSATTYLMKTINTES